MQALIFDSFYDNYRGAISYVRIVDGRVRVGDKIHMMASNHDFEVTELGALRPGGYMPMDEMRAGDVGYIAASIKDIADIHVGDTITLCDRPAANPLPGYKKVLPEFAELVEDIEQADVVIADCTQMNDAAELIIEDAKDAGKKLVIVANAIDPDTYMLENGDAVLALTFSRPADHGTGAGGFITTTEPIMLAKLLFGDAEPAGMVVKELARDSAMDDAQWKDLAGDQGANQWVRMMLLATMKTSENNTVPNNWGDPLVQYQYGMKYGEKPEFVYDTLVLPRATHEVVTESNGSTRTSYESVVETKAGVPFNAYVLLWNNGADGMTTVQATCDGEVIAQKIMAVNGGDWRVVEMTLTIDEPGEHVVTVGDLTKTITIVE